MRTIQRSITIDAPPDKVFGYITNTERLPEWIPSMMDVCDIEGEGMSRSYGWTYKMAGVNLNGKSAVKQFEADAHYTTRSDGNVISEWDYALEPTDDGGTELTLTVSYELPVPVLGKLAEPLLLKRNEREADVAIHSLKDIVEAEA